MSKNVKTYESLSDLPWEPTRPGKIIQQDILERFGLSQEQLRQHLHVSRKTVNELVVGKRGITPEMSLRLALLTGQSAEYWLNLQSQYDLWRARSTHTEMDITPLF